MQDLIKNRFKVSFKFKVLTLLNSKFGSLKDNYNRFENYYKEYTIIKINK